MLATEFKEWRKKLGLTQEEAAAHVFHVSRVTIQNWESGTSQISRSVEMHCELHLRHWEQERKRRPNYGPVKLYYCGNFEFGSGISAQPKIFADNASAVKEAIEACTDNSEIEPFIQSIEGDDIWTIRELKEEIARRRAAKEKDVTGLIAKLNAIADHFSSSASI